ncbi:hypothetical protein MIMGU_mgv1a001093mg [Erythranthe guttata]|uniref:Uncharacterized protein n=1 Tax=Erythranthe guttata TaxID=4155 RepID=A0A022PSA1_ERYGU|nr:hypothetical protein MIMGU_mgv1a001093mg [Erythranthe guttata]
MAYGAAGCLELTIERLLKSSYISIVQNSSPQIIKLLYKEILSLKEALREFDKKRSTINMKMVKSLEAEMVEAIYKFEDVIDPHLSNQFHSQSEEEEETADHPPSMVFSVDVQEIKQDVDSFIETMNIMKRAYVHELCNPSPEEEEDGVVPSRIDFGVNESNMVGLSDLFMTIKDRLDSEQSEGMIVSLNGMAGIGKTTLAKKLFQDPFIVNCYIRLVFVTIGPKYRLADILVDILTQVNSDIDEIMLMKGEKGLAGLKRMVYESLKHLRFLIVLDDVWEMDLCFVLLELFPDDKYRSRVLVTTRMEEVANCAKPLNIFNIFFLDKKESWDLLREKVFGEEEPCSYGLEKAGKKIAENCEGLPLTIITVANILSKVDKTIEYWNEVADDKQNSVYKDAYEQMSKVLYPSYDYLDQHLKACFLYIGAFPQNYLLDLLQLANLWSAEGFLNSESMQYSEPTMNCTYDSYEYLYDLRAKNLIMFDNETSRLHLHSSFWYLCNKEAARTKLFYALNCHGDTLPEEGIESQRRLCIRNNVLLAIKDVHNSIASDSKVRSLLCTGYFHKYPVPLFLEHLRLLRVLEARSIRFYEFPIKVLKLVQLRYLALLYNGNLPSSIFKLWNLQNLIVVRHLKIVKSIGNLLYLPIEIWNMNELKYLYTCGRDLPHPYCEGSLLPNLLNLCGVGPQSCAKSVLEKIPNLKELSIHIELAPDATEPLTCFDHISHLHQLQELGCYIMNPTLKTDVVTPLVPLSDFPLSLTKLYLKGLGYPWEEMRKISSLPNLTHLFLECYAFRGPKWEVRDNEFQSLLCLNIEDIDLEQLTFQNCHCLPVIESLHISHCYKLKEIPLTFGKSLVNIKVVECNPMAVKCAIKLKEEWDDKYAGRERLLELVVRSSL